jgi:hypothetical protein
MPVQATKSKNSPSLIRRRMPASVTNTKENEEEKHEQ